MTLAQLEGIWVTSGFVSEPPTAAVILTDKAGDHTHVVELTDARRSGGRVSFQMRPVPTATEAGYTHDEDPRPGTRGRARIFIDDAAPSPCSIATASPTSLKLKEC